MSHFFSNFRIARPHTTFLSCCQMATEETSEKGWAGQEKFVRKSQLLELFNADSEQSEESEKSDPSDIDPSVINQVGGAPKKRGRDGDDFSTHYESKTQRLHQLSSAAKEVGMRVEMSGAKSNVITAMVSDFIGCSNTIASDPKKALDALMESVSSDDVQAFLSSVATTKNLGTRFKTIAQSAFAIALANMKEIQALSVLCEKQTIKTVEQIFVANFADSSGDINWGSVISFMAKKVEGDGDDPEELSGGGGSGGGGGGGDAPSKGKGRGRPPKST